MFILSYVQYNFTTYNYLFLIVVSETLTTLIISFKCRLKLCILPATSNAVKIKVLFLYINMLGNS